MRVLGAVAGFLVALAVATPLVAPPAGADALVVYTFTGLAAVKHQSIAGTCQAQGYFRVDVVSLGVIDNGAPAVVNASLYSSPCGTYAEAYEGSGASTVGWRFLDPTTNMFGSVGPAPGGLWQVNLVMRGVTDAQGNFTQITSTTLQETGTA